MSTHTGYIAFSYNFDGDRHFVAKLGDEMHQRGVLTWYLPELVKPTNITTQQRLGGDFDWRNETQNWHAAFAERLYEAKGIIVVLSPAARQSRETVGRGMWRERAAVDFIRADKTIRVREIDNPSNHPESEIPEGLVDELVEWGKMVLALPPVERRSIGDPNAFNTPTGETGPLQLPEHKSKPTDWYELVRLDLYDVEWHCRRCSLKSYSYIMAHENPPERCPRCGFTGYEPDYEAAGLAQPAGPRRTFKDKDDATQFSLSMVKESMKVLSLSRQALELQQSRQHDEAMKLNFQLERLCRKLGVLEPLAEAYGDQALYLHQHEKLDGAAELYGHAERLCREIGDKVHLQQYLGNLGTILTDYGRLDTAMQRLKEQERLNRGLENKNSLEMSLGNQARILIKQGEGGKAMELLKEQERICRELGKKDGLDFSFALQTQIENGETE